MSDVLRTAITMCHACPTPIILWHGEELTVVANQTGERVRTVLQADAERWRTIRSTVETVMQQNSAASVYGWRLTPLVDGARVTAVVATPLHDAKDDFLAMVGHELRNPLASVSTMLQALLLRNRTPELSLIERSVRSLTGLLEVLLESARLSRGKIELQRRVTELASVIDRALEIVSPQLTENRHRVTVNVPRIGVRVEADCDRLSRALANVVANASQHTPPGGRIAIESQTSDGRVHVRVLDDGSGASPEVPPSVFNAYGDQRVNGSVGLGLMIANGVIELHGGTITITSQGPGRGTVCDIDLPTTAQVAIEPPVAAPTTTRRRLMLVEDNDDAARALRMALEQLGYDVAVAHDAPIALNLAKTFQPDVALLDLGLPIMDGWELARRLKTALEPPPVVAVTARDQEPDQQRPAGPGFADHLVKPIDLAQLQRLVDRLTAAPAEEA